MREIKFRFWIEDIKRIATWEQAKKECDRLGILELEGYTPMQYTGLKDNNGVEIYEGDILRMLYTDWGSKSGTDSRSLEQYLIDISSIGVVVFEEDRFCVRFKDDKYGGYSTSSIFEGAHGRKEVNIHEHPNLLI